MKSKHVALIGAPTDIGAGTRGASMGPEALRVAQLQPVLEAQGIVVHDRGNLGGPANPWQPPVDGYRHLREVVEWNRLVHEAVHAELGADRLPILLGGDHSLAIGSIAPRPGIVAPPAASSACCGSMRTPTSTRAC